MEEKVGKEAWAVTLESVVKEEPVETLDVVGPEGHSNTSQELAAVFVAPMATQNCRHEMGKKGRLEYMGQTEIQVLSALSAADFLSQATFELACWRRPQIEPRCRRYGEPDIFGRLSGATRFVSGPDWLTTMSARYLEMAHFGVGANSGLTLA